MYQNNELYHYGVKGMKWKNHTYATQEELKAAKKKFKAQKKIERIKKKAFKSDRDEMIDAIKSNSLSVDGVTIDQYGDYDLSTARSIRKTSEVVHARLAKEKGKKYANAVLDSANSEIRDQRVGEIVGSAAFVLGSAAVIGILAYTNR